MIRETTDIPIWDSRTTTSAISVGAGANVAITLPDGARRMVLSVLEQAGEDLFITDDSGASTAEGLKIGGGDHKPIQLRWDLDDAPSLRALNTSGAAVNLGVLFFWN